MDKIASTEQEKHKRNAQKFVEFARRSVGVSDTEWFEALHIHDIAVLLNINGALHRDYDLNHWLLVLGANKNGSLTVYDTMYPNTNGDHIYTHERKPRIQDITFATIPLTQRLKLYGEEWLNNEEYRRRDLHQKKYSLHLPQAFSRLKLQTNGFDCGPLALYAAVVANQHTPAFKGRVNLEELRREGITL
mgnify:CR=1 FL=1